MSEHTPVKNVDVVPKDCDSTLVWVNVMRLKQDQRLQMVYAASEEEFVMLQRLVDRSGEQLRQAECEYLNKFSLMIQNKLQQDGFRAMCDFCDTAYATREISKQTVLSFRDIDTMRNNSTYLDHFKCYGRPKLTFHDQIWSCCSSNECFAHLERANIEEFAKMNRSDSNYRIPTKLAHCYTCNIKHGVFKCSRCLVTVYCSKECQRVAWPTHKQSCKACL